MQFTVFSSLSRLKAGGSRPRPGPFARDRALLSPRRPQQGQASTRCVTRHSGVEPCSSGVHVDAGHHTMLAPAFSRVVGIAKIANIVQEEKTGTDTAIQDPEPFGPTPRAHTTLRSPLTLRLERAYCRPAALPSPGPVVHERQRPGIHTTLRLAVVANPEVSLSAAPSPLTPRSPTAQPSLFTLTAIARFALALNCAALWPSCFPSSLPPLPSPSGPAALFVALCASPSPVHGVAPRRNRSPFPTRGMASAGADCDVRGLTRD